VFGKVVSDVDLNTKKNPSRYTLSDGIHLITLMETCPFLFQANIKGAQGVITPPYENYPKSNRICCF
jgi:hypothetical protein